MILPTIYIDKTKSLMIKVDITSPNSTFAQIFFTNIESQAFNGDQSVGLSVEKGRREYSFFIPENNVNGNMIRFDPGSLPGKYLIHTVKIYESETY